MNKLLVILGPTATGKTDLALQLAHKFGGELISADSRQVYKGLDIGTGKEPGRKSEVKKHKGFWEIDGIKIWMYDVVSLAVQYTVKDYVDQASKVIDQILERGKLPIIVGGTGLYLKGLIEGFSNLSIPVDEKLREELEGLSLEELQQRLKKDSLKRWQDLNESDRQNPRRLLRVIELAYMNPYSRTDQLPLNLDQKFNILKVGLTAPRPVLNSRTDSRVLDWIDQGLVKEVEKLIDEVGAERVKSLGLGYGVIVNYLQGNLETEEMIQTIKFKNRQYAKRQETWFKKVADICWFNITDKQFQGKVEKLASSWYDSPDDASY